MMKTMTTLSRPTVLAALMLLAACGGRNEAEGIAAARAQLAKGDSAAASIELKNVLQKNADSGEARYLLGKLLYETGSPAGAEAELSRALEAGYEEDLVLPVMASVQLALQKPGLMVQQFGKVELKDARAAAELKTLVATAHMSSGSLDEAAEALNNALRRAPDYAPALVLQARLKAAQGDNAQAHAMVDKLLASVPGNAAAWLLKGDLLMLEGGADKAPAIQAYRSALARQPDLIMAHVAVLSLLIAQRDFDGANQQWTGLKKALPNHPQTSFFEGVLALQKGDAKRTREIAQLMLRSAPNSPRVLLLAGQAELALNALTQAETMLGKAVQLAPDARPPRRTLAEVYLRSGQADKALLVLKPLLDSKVEDAEVLALTARAQLMTGNAAAAEASFARAAKLKPDDKRLQTSVALARLGRAKGQDSSAYDELEAIAKSEAGSMADLALISARMKRQEWGPALKAVEALVVKQPKQAMPEYLRGRIALQQRDPAAARKAFEAALAKEPGYFLAIASLGDLDLVDGKPEAAKARLEALLRAEPGHAQARLALASLAARTGASKQDVAKLLEAAVAAKPEDANARAALVDHYMGAGDPKAALSAAQNAVAALPENPDLLDRLGRVQLASQDISLALATFTKMATLQPRSALPHLRLADVHLANKDLAAAQTSVRRAIDAAPTSLPAQRAGIMLALRDKKPAQAMQIARNLQAQRPAEAVGYLFEGEIELGQQQHEPAAAAFRKALTKTQPGDAAMRLHFTLLAAKKKAEADRLAESWVKEHPEDAAFTLYLGDIALAQNNLAEAEARYRQVLKRTPDNVVALNNVAFILASQKKPGAVEMAERAVKLAPDQAALMDTLALTYAESDQLAKAVALQAKVVALAPNAPEFRWNLAKFQLQSGNKAGARTELQILSKLGKDYARHEEVDKLLKTLGG